MRFLNARGRIAGDNQIHIRNSATFPAVAAEQGDRLQSTRLGLFQGTSDILRLTTCRDRDEHVAGIGKSANLPRENFIEPIVVCGRGEQTSALRKIQRWIWSAIFDKPARELRRKIGGIGCAPPVAAGEYFLFSS